MANEIIPIQGLDTLGLIADTPSIALANNAFSDALNVRFDDGAIRKVKGYVEIFATHGLTDIRLLAFWPNPNKPMWVVVNRQDVSGIAKDFIYTLELDSAGALVSPVNRSYDTTNGYTASSSWQHTVFNGGYSFIINNAAERPQHITAQQGVDLAVTSLTSADKFADLPGWDSYTSGTVAANDLFVTCKIIVAFNNLLVAGGLLEIDTSNANAVVRNLRGVVRSSDVAAPGTIPQNWNPFATGAGTADELLIADTGDITSIVELQGKLMVYTASSINQVNVTEQGLTSISLTREYGAASLHSVIEFDGKHIVQGSNDIYQFTGHPASIQSISDGRVRRFYYNNVHGSYTSNTMIIRDNTYDEIWVCYVSNENTVGKLDTALVWNYRTNVWSKRSLPNLSTIASGPITGGGVDTFQFSFDLNQDSGISGRTVTGSTTSGTAEVQTITYAGTDTLAAGTKQVSTSAITGTRSTSSRGNNEVYTFTIDSNFNSGTATLLSTTVLASTLPSSGATINNFGVTGLTVENIPRITASTTTDSNNGVATITLVAGEYYNFKVGLVVTSPEGSGGAGGAIVINSTSNDSGLSVTTTSSGSRGSYNHNNFREAAIMLDYTDNIIPSNYDRSSTATRIFRETTNNDIAGNALITPSDNQTLHRTIMQFRKVDGINNSNVNQAIIISGTATTNNTLTVFRANHGTIQNIVNTTDGRYTSLGTTSSNYPLMTQEGESNLYSWSNSSGGIIQVEGVSVTGTASTIPISGDINIEHETTTFTAPTTNGTTSNLAGITGLTLVRSTPSTSVTQTFKEGSVPWAFGLPYVSGATGNMTYTLTNTGTVKYNAYIGQNQHPSNDQLTELAAGASRTVTIVPNSSGHTRAYSGAGTYRVSRTYNIVNTEYKISNTTSADYTINGVLVSANTNDVDVGTLSGSVTISSGAASAFNIDIDTNNIVFLQPATTGSFVANVNANDAAIVIRDAIRSNYSLADSLVTSSGNVVTVDTNQTENISASASITSGTGASNASISISGSNGSSSLATSTYTLISPSGTSYVINNVSVTTESESDLDDLISNFNDLVSTATITNTSSLLTITEDLAQAVTGNWSLTASHETNPVDSARTGDLNFATFTTTTTGVDGELATGTITPPNGTAITYTITNTTESAIDLNGFVEDVKEAIQSNSQLSGYTITSATNVLTFTANSSASLTNSFAATTTTGGNTFTPTVATTVNGQDPTLAGTLLIESVLPNGVRTTIHTSSLEGQTATQVATLARNQINANTNFTASGTGLNVDTQNTAFGFLAPALEITTTLGTYIDNASTGVATTLNPEIHTKTSLQTRDLERPWPSTFINQGFNFLVGASAPTSSSNPYDLYAFDVSSGEAGQAFTSYVERKNVHVRPTKDTETIDAIYLDTQGSSINSGTQQFTIRVAMTDAAGKVDSVDLTSNATETSAIRDDYTFNYGDNGSEEAEHKVDSRLTGRIMNYRITETSANDYSIAEMALEIAKGGER